MIVVGPEANDAVMMTMMMMIWAYLWVSVRYAGTF